MKEKVESLYKALEVDEGGSHEQNAPQAREIVELELIHKEEEDLAKEAPRKKEESLENISEDLKTQKNQSRKREIIKMKI